MQYISWDGQLWSAAVGPETGVFTHTRQGASLSHYLLVRGGLSLR